MSENYNHNFKVYYRFIWTSLPIWTVDFNCMSDSKPQRCVQPHKTLNVTRNATNLDKHINEASTQTFANNAFKIKCNDTQGMLSNWKICFNVLNIRTDDERLRKLVKL